MVFTRAGRVVAWLAVVLGASRIALALIVIQMENSAAVSRYFGSETTGEAMNMGVYMLIFGVVLGVLTDISRSLGSSDA